MTRFGHRYSRPGSAPGLLQHAEGSQPTPTTLRIIDYNRENLIEQGIDRVEEAFERLDDETVTWLDIVGTADLEVIRSFGEHLDIHPLVLEDLVNTGQRPKLEEHEGHLFIVLRLIHQQHEAKSEQISFLIGPSWVITLQEYEGDCFGGVRERIRHGKGRIRGRGADYLAYALIDSIVDSFFPTLEQYGDEIETLEEDIVADPDRGTLSQIHAMKKNILALRRAAWPQRYVIRDLERHESPLFTPETAVFLRDCYDHSMQIMDIVDNYRDLAGDLMDLYLSTVSNRANEVMRVLTVIASIFIPLTFIAGVYGMNFNPEASPWNMPELNTRLGYPLVWLAMLGLGLGMLAFFRKKKWL